MAKIEGYTGQPQEHGWWLQAACKGIYDFSENSNIEAINEGKKALCNKCPVLEACLEDAMKYGDVYVFRAARKPDELNAEFRTRGLKRERGDGKNY